MDLAREDKERVGARKRDKVVQVKWRILSRCGDPELGETIEEEEDCTTEISHFTIPKD